MEEIIYEYENVDEIVEKGHELKVINGCEFQVIENEDGTLSLEDMQGANLAGICEERFYNLAEILDRLEGSYLHDYEYVCRY